MSALIQFINAHGGCQVVRVCECGKKLEVSSICVLPGNFVVTQFELIDATMKAALDWLGY